MVSVNGNGIEYKYKGRGVFEPAINLKDYLLRIIVKRGAIMRPALVALTGVPRTTVYDALIKLVLDKRIRKYSVSAKTRGRPRVFYESISSGDSPGTGENDIDSTEDSEVYRPDLFNY